jgi:hypothetical protein
MSISSANFALGRIVALCLSPIAALSISAEPAHAVSMTSGCAHVNNYCTLAELSSSSAFININNIYFNNFRVGSDAAFIKVVPVDSGGFVGLRFVPLDPLANPWEVSVGSSSTYHYFADDFLYDVRDFQGRPITYTKLSTKFTVGGNLLFPTAYADSTGPTYLKTDCSHVDDVYGDCLGATDNVASYMASYAFTIEQEVFGDYTGDPMGGPAIVAITEVTQRFGVPEPLTLTLFGAGLLGLAATRRRRR